MRTVSSRSREVAELIRDRVPFKTYGALRADEGPIGRGYLSGDDLARMEEDYRRVDYVVWSYFTPIAWHTPDKGWYKVKAKFSRTTSKHQGELYLI